MTQLKRIAYVACGLSVVAVLAGCATPAILSGGGSMPSTFASGNGKATFTFSGDSCTETTNGLVNYVDKAPKSMFGQDVKFNGVVTAAGPFFV